MARRGRSASSPRVMDGDDRGSEKPGSRPGSPPTPTGKSIFPPASGMRSPNNAEIQMLSDALQSPASVPAKQPALPSSKDWYGQGAPPLPHQNTQLSGSQFINALKTPPSSVIQRSSNRRSTCSKAISSHESIGIGLFGELGGSALSSPSGRIHSASSPGCLLDEDGDDVAGHEGGYGGSIGIAFKGVDLVGGGLESPAYHYGGSSSSSRKRRGTQDGNGNKRGVSSHDKRSPISNDTSPEAYTTGKSVAKFSPNSAKINKMIRKRFDRGQSGVLYSPLGDDRHNSETWTPEHEPNYKSNKVTPAAGQGTIRCNCKKSRCLKLYCDCFRLSKFCKGCNCLDCSNCEEKEADWAAARNSILERNPEAFAPRIKQDPDSMHKGHLSGCHCKKSACLKKYCECFSAGVACADKCRCLDCKNMASTDTRDDRVPSAAVSPEAFPALNLLEA